MFQVSGGFTLNDQVLFSLKNNEKIFINVVCCSLVRGRFSPIPVRTLSRFGPMPFRSGSFGPISGVGRFGLILVGFGSLLYRFLCIKKFFWLAWIKFMQF